MTKALIVDDEPQVRDLTRRALGKYGFDCEVAEDGEAALMLCNGAHIDVVVTDLRMPRRHGHSLAVELLNRPNPPRVLVVTGLAEPRLVRDLMSRGVDDFLHKPVNYEVLAMKVLALAEKGSGGPRATRPATNAAPAPAEKTLNSIERSLAELTEIFEDSLHGLFDLDEELNDPPKAVSDFITRFAQQEQVGAAENKMPRDSRESERVRCDVTAVALPVTRRFDRCGDPFRVAIRDLSENGIRLLHTRATNTQFLALSWRADTLPSTEIRVVSKVLRCRPLSPFYDIGGEFVLAD